MEALALFLMAGGGIFEGLQQYKQAKKQSSYLKAQAAEYIRQSKYVEEMGREEQISSLLEEDIALGSMKARTAKAGLRLGGSAATRRKALSTRYTRQRRLIEMETVERSEQLRTAAEWLRKRAKDVKKAGRWGLLTSLLGSGSQAAYGAYKSGMFGDLFGGGIKYSSSTARAASIGSGAYAGTMGGGPTGGYSRSMIG